MEACIMEESVCGSTKLRDSGPLVSAHQSSSQIVVITIFSVFIGVIFILILALYIYANKHRHEKRNTLLSSSLVGQEVKEPAV